jgi:hypothetical protein
MKRPPRFASPLLERLGFADSAMTGDLDEGYAAGRSGLWYWRQVIGAIVFGTARGIRHNKLATMRALAIGAAFVWFISRFVLLPVLGFDEWLFTRGIAKWIYLNHWGMPPWISLTPAKALMFAMSGWIVGRTHRRYGAPIVLAYAAFTAFANIPNFIWLSKLDFPIYTVPRLVQNLFVIYPSAVLLGGLWALSADVASSSDAMAKSSS